MAIFIIAYLSAHNSPCQVLPYHFFSSTTAPQAGYRQRPILIVYLLSIARYSVLWKEEREGRKGARGEELSHARSLLSLEPTEGFSFWPDSTEKVCNQAKPDACGVVFKTISRKGRDENSYRLQTKGPLIRWISKNVKGCGLTEGQWTVNREQWSPKK
jgi:hypothetical protein